MTLDEIISEMRARKCQVAPGSESAEWQEFVEDCYLVFGHVPWHDALISRPIDRSVAAERDFEVFWSAVVKSPV
jgi:hypothetical protein